MSDNVYIAMHRYLGLTGVCIYILHFVLPLNSSIRDGVCVCMYMCINEYICVCMYMCIN